MNNQKYDVAVIGAGPGGYIAAIRAAQLGFKTACIEKSKTLGGTCLNVGCIPSKTLLQSTEFFATLVHEGKLHGITGKDYSIDFDKLMQRKSEVVKGLVDGIAASFQRNRIDRIEGKATFLSPNTIEITQDKSKKQLEASHFILATGSEPIALPFLPFDEKQILSSTGALALSSVPKKMVVIGGGVIGVELASVYQRLGTEVIVIEMLDRICIAMDELMSRTLLQILKKQGIQFHLSTKVLSAQKKDNEVILKVEQEKQEVEFKAPVVLVAVGRRPYTEGLGLQNIGISCDSKGFIPVNSTFRTQLPHIFAIGDLIEGPMLAHRASDEGVAVAEIIAGKKPFINYLSIPNVIYTHPEVAALGLTEKEAKELGLELLVGKAFFKGNPRARCMGYTEGLVKLIGEKQSGRVIGIHLIGSHVSEMIGEGVVAIQKRATLQEIGDMSHAHPTLSEAIKEAALSALNRALH